MMDTRYTEMAVIADPQGHQGETDSVDSIPPDSVEYREAVNQSDRSENDDTAAGNNDPIVGADADNFTSSYRVNFVEEDDVLNVRSGPGVIFPVVGKFPLSTVGIKV